MANNPISQSNQFEFNDSVLTTKAWNSSRYDGRQLSATEINKFTTGDSTYGKTPVIQNYTRNIYIGNDIVSIDSETREASNLLPIDNFSYLQTNRFITVNEDDTITDVRLEEIGDDINPKIGFYQSFFDDFPEQSGCRVVLFDNIAKNNLKPNYTIYFNGGQLNQIFRYRPGLTGFTNPYKIFYTTGSGGIEGNNSVILTGSAELINDALGLNTQIHNEDLLRDFYADVLTNVGTSIVFASLHNEVYSDLFNHKNNSEYKNNKRFFLSFMESGSGDSTVLRTVVTGSIPIGTTTAIRTNNLAELSTGEIRSSSINDTQHNLEIFFTNKSILNQNYIASDNEVVSKPETAHFGDVVLSQNIDNIPSLLVNLNKSSELVNDSNNVYAIIPENLHPYVKDNILFFLTQAGIDVGGNTSTLLKINPSNRLLK